MVRVGAASRIINNEIGAFVQAATHDKVAKSVRDDLEANLLYIDGREEAVLLINCDVAVLESDVIQEVRSAVSDKTGVPPRNILVSCTHTHSGPVVFESNPFRSRDMEWAERLRGWLVEAAVEAVEGARPCRMGWGLGEAKIGYNRRACWADGTHTMGRDTAREDFTGIEGPQDPSHLVLFAEDGKGNVVAVLHNNSCHAVNFYGAEFYSADYPGLARTLLRDVLGPIPVLYLNGGFGDNWPRDLLHPQPPVGGAEGAMRRQAYTLAGETLRLMSRAERCDTPIVRHVCEDLRVPVRLPDPQQVERDRELLAKGRADKDSVPRWELLFAFGRCRLVDCFGDDPVDELPVHAVRIGDLGLGTNPCELYGQFMMDIRRRSPAPLTMFADVTDGYSGYCPTMSALITGGYSGETIHWTRLAADTGYRIVDTASKLLHSLWRS